MAGKCERVARIVGCVVQHVDRRKSHQEHKSRSKEERDGAGRADTR